MKPVQVAALVSVALMELMMFRHAAADARKQPTAGQKTIVLREGSLTDTFNAPMLELARAVRIRPQSRVFQVSGYLMFGGYQSWDFWYDRQTQRLRYRYASGGETKGGKEEGVWSGVTNQVLQKLAQDRQADNHSGTRLLGFETLGKYGCKLEWANKTAG